MREESPALRHDSATCDPVVIAVDPGRAKCGVAVLSSSGVVLSRAVVPTESLIDNILALARQYSPQTLVVGDGTGSAPVIAVLGLACDGIPLVTVDESHTSELARSRYLSETPRRGFRRLLPSFLRTPEQAYDDFVAVILAERWLQKDSTAR